MVVHKARVGSCHLSIQYMKKTASFQGPVFFVTFALNKAIKYNTDKKMSQFKNIPISRKNNVMVKALFLFVFFLSFIFVVNFFNLKIKNSFYSLSSPFEKKLWALGNYFSSSVSPLLNPNSLLKENTELKQKNTELLAQILSFQASNKAQEAANVMYSNAQNENLDLAMASIIGSDEDRMIVINKGLDDGLKSDMPVVDQHNILFGKIETVYKNFSTVMMISDKKSVINIKIKNDSPDSKDEVSGLLRGDGNFNVYLDLIPIDKQISADDVVVTSSLEKVFPKDLLIGKVTSVEKNSQKPFQQAAVTPFFNLMDTDYVFVVKGYK